MPCTVSSFVHVQTQMWDIEILDPVVGCCISDVTFSAGDLPHERIHTDDVAVEWQFYDHHTCAQTHISLNQACAHLLSHRQGGQRDAPVQSVSTRCLNMIATHPKAYGTHCSRSAFQTAPVYTGPYRCTVSKTQTCSAVLLPFSKRLSEKKISRPSSDSSYSPQSNSPGLAMLRAPPQRSL